MVKHLITLDFESYWDQHVTLSKLSPMQYLDHPEFEAISVAIKVDDKPTRVFFGDAIAKVFAGIPWDKCLVVGHNLSEFDGLILAWKYGIKPAAWGCTLAMARPHYQKEIGGSLKALAAHFGLQAKGSLEATNTKGKRLVDFTDEEREAMAEYNKLDVDIAYELFKRLRPMTSAREMRLIDMTIRMFVEPQLMLDQDALREARHAELRRRMQSLKDLAMRLGQPSIEDLKKTLASSAKFKDILWAQGVDCPMKTSPTTGKSIPALAKTDQGMADLLEHPNEIIRAAAETRLEVKSTILESRIGWFLDTVRPDGRMPVPLRYCGADQTWRWSGTAGGNMQNLPRVNGRPTDVLRKSLIAPPGHKVVVADLSGIELRVNHFLWKVPESMVLYQENPKADLYRAYAAALYDCKPEDVTKLQRARAKLDMLSLGYQTGWKKFQETARNSGMLMSEQETKEAVYGWRDHYHEIVKGWGILQDSIQDIRRGAVRTLDPWDLYQTEKDGIRFIPHNTLIQYPDLSLEADGNWTFQKTPRKRAHLFGGKMCEQTVSHASRHVMTDAILSIAKTKLGRKYPLAHTVHDELIYVVKEDDAEEMLALVNSTLATSPTWWPELVTFSEGDIADSYGEAK